MSGGRCLTAPNAGGTSKYLLAVLEFLVGTTTLRPLPWIDLTRLTLPWIDLTRLALPWIDLTRLALPWIDLTRLTLPWIDLTRLARGIKASGRSALAPGVTVGVGVFGTPHTHWPLCLRNKLIAARPLAGPVNRGPGGLAK